LLIYEPEQASFGDERRTNVLWGRIVALGVVLLLVFLLGRATGGDGSSQQVEDLQARLASAQAEIEQLDRQVRSQATPTTPTGTGEETTATTIPTGTASPGTSGGAATTSSPRTGSTTTTTTSTEDQIYTVKAGDSLRSIAAKFYGNAKLEGCIAKAQDPPITDPTKLQLGKKLTIPRPTPTAPC
jgi:nucleoid-associated protein YgaU